MDEKQVSKQVKNVLERLEYSGDLQWYERLNSGKVRTEYGSWLQLCRAGTADYIAICINKQKSISVIFIECKNSSGGKISPDQHKFCEKFSRIPNFHYVIISDANKLAGYILNIAYDRLNDIIL